MTIETEKYKTLLEKELGRITEDLKGLGIHNPGNPNDWIEVPEQTQPEADPIDVADRAEDWHERRATIAQLETEYNDVRRALGKIEAGTYGVCEISGEEIEAARLDADPAARTCIAHREEESKLPRP